MAPVNETGAALTIQKSFRHRPRSVLFRLEKSRRWGDRTKFNRSNRQERWEIRSLANVRHLALGVRSNDRETASAYTGGSEPNHRQCFASCRLPRFPPIRLSSSSICPSIRPSFLGAGHPYRLSESPSLLPSDLKEWAMAFGQHARKAVTSSSRHWACP